MTAAELAALADEIDMRLNNENAGRQTICEDVAARLRQLAAAAPAPAELAARRTAARATLNDYRREVLDGLAGGPVPDWAPWTHRLGNALGQVLDELDRTGPPAAAAELTPQHRAMLGQALADAIAYRDPGGQCHDCEAEYGGLCYDHAADLDKTDAYLGVARDLGIEVDR